MGEIQKKYIEAPDLPKVVQGDGRYFIIQLRRILSDMALQVNRANGFESNEQVETTGIAPPPNFTLTFSTEGGIFQWSDPSYFKDVVYYEVRTNPQVGTLTGLLERTTNNYSKKMPVSYSGTAYLFAILKDGKSSNGAVLDYTKPRPEKPEDINLTRNDRGTLINWTLTPLDCIGSHVYINGTMYETRDNLLLYTGDRESINEVAIAYYDDFGEGEKGFLYCRVPPVQGFTVERNGAVLDFYWRSVGINGAGYVVKASSTNNWANGIEIFRTSLLKKKLEYPKTGDVYFLIKAYDEHGNYSQKAAWFLLTTMKDQQKNIIVDFDEGRTMYTGAKVGTYYDARNNGIRLSEGQYTGEYIASGHLPYKARARSWAEFDFTGITDADITISDLTFSADSDRAKITTMVGGVVSNIDGTTVETYIATKESETPDYDLAVPLDGSLSTLSGESPTEAVKCDTFESARWGSGLKVTEMTRLAYKLKKAKRTFSAIFRMRLFHTIGTCNILMITGEGVKLQLFYRHGYFGLYGSDGNTMRLPLTPNASDFLTIGISQSETERALYIKSMNPVLPEDALSTTIEAPPVGEVDALQFYK